VAAAIVLLMVAVAPATAQDRAMSAVVVAPIAAVAPVVAQDRAPTTVPAATAQALTLEELERRALANNPTLAQAAALIEEARGRQDQAGRYPNPRVGYAGEEFAFRDIGRTSEHLFVYEQEILLGGKRGRRRAVFEHQEDAAAALASAQEMRVRNGVRLLYYRALAAAELVAIQEALAEVTRDGVLTARELENLGQADRADLLAAQIEARQAELELAAARAERERTWRQLGAMIGDPGLQPQPLDLSVDGELPRIDFDQALEALLAGSPQLEAARAELRRAEAVLDREGAEAVPDLNVRSGIGYNLDRFELGPRSVGLEMFVEATVPLPIFDRRQGDKLAALALIDEARQEVARLQLSLRADLAELYAAYAAELLRTEVYRDDMLPLARETADLYAARFEEMIAAYPQVLAARRSVLQLRASYVRAWEGMWMSAIAIRGALLTDGLAAAVSR
jgi:cobalt-zinc-cadmium efflux system outer membrane protein